MQVGHDARHRHAAKLFQLLEPGLQYLFVAAEFIDDSAFDTCSLVLIQQSYGPIELREHAAAVDISHQQHGSVHQLRQPHVDDVFVFKVDLCRTARAFDDDDIVFGGQRFVGLHDVGHKLTLALVVFHGLHIADRPAHDHHLRAHVRRRLQQDGVHADVGLRPGGLLHTGVLCHGSLGFVLLRHGLHRQGIDQQQRGQQGQQLFYIHHFTSLGCASSIRKGGGEACHILLGNKRNIYKRTGAGQYSSF